MESTGRHEGSQACTRQSIPDSYCTADCCALRSVVSSLRVARLSVCTIRMRVSCVQSASAPPRPPSSMQTVAGCVHDLHKPGVCGVPATVAHGRPLWAVGPGEPCAVVDCDRSNHALGRPTSPTYIDAIQARRHPSLAHEACLVWCVCLTTCRIRCMAAGRMQTLTPEDADRPTRGRRDLESADSSTSLCRIAPCFSSPSPPLPSH